MRILTAVTVLTYAMAWSHSGPAGSPGTLRTPVLVELFTSEGCSSCPPVDAMVRQIDSAQPLANAQLIVLSEHVDYWNHDGWKDPYSSAQFTERQEGYVRAFKLDDPYTPQIIINGAMLVRSYDPRQLRQTFERAVMAPEVAVKIDSVDIAEGSPPVLRTRIEADGTSATTQPVDVYLAIALDHAQSQVSAGENNGKRLEHVAVVEYLKKIGKLDAGKSFTQDCQVKLKKGTDPTNLRVVAFVQEPGPGKVLGAALRKPAVTAASTP